MRTIYILGVVCFLCACDARPTNECRDDQIWIADGGYACSDLYTKTRSGIYRKAHYYCTEYSQTSCCQTCKLLGYSKPKGNAATSTTVSMVTTSPQKITVEVSPEQLRILQMVMSLMGKQ